MKCSACKIIAHASCIAALMERSQLACKPTFRDVGVRQYREQTRTLHHWIHRRTEKGKCKQCGKVSIWGGDVWARLKVRLMKTRAKSKAKVRWGCGWRRKYLHIKFYLIISRINGKEMLKCSGNSRLCERLNKVQRQASVLPIRGA